MSRLVAKIEVGNKLNGARARNGWRCSHTRGRTYKHSANVKSANRRDTRCLEIASGQMYHSRGWNSLFSSKKKKRNNPRVYTRMYTKCIRIGNVFRKVAFEIQHGERLRTFRTSFRNIYVGNVCRRRGQSSRRIVI